MHGWTAGQYSICIRAFEGSESESVGSCSRKKLKFERSELEPGIDPECRPSMLAICARYVSQDPPPWAGWKIEQHSLLVLTLTWLCGAGFETSQIKLINAGVSNGSASTTSFTFYPRAAGN